MSARDSRCQVCGHDAFEHQDVLWPELIAEWGLSVEEAAYVNVQQGTHCAACKTNVRSQALARALLEFLGTDRPLESALNHPPLSTLRLLELNEAERSHPGCRACRVIISPVIPTWT